MEIRLFSGEIALVDKMDKDLSEKRWHISNKRYAANGSKNVLMHRIILEKILNRKLESTEQVDHRNGNTLDNRRGNLRLATSSQNQMNQPPPSSNTSGFKGVVFVRDWKRKRPWKAQIKIDDKLRLLGYFQTPEEAALAYDEAAKNEYGEFAWTNF